MSKQITKPTFDQWVAYVFDHPVQKRAWYWRDYADHYSPTLDPRRTVTYLHRLFASSAEHTKPYSNAQINQGFMFLIDNARSDHIFALFDQRVPRQIRVETVRFFYNVFEQIFAPRCTPKLSHSTFDKTESRQLNPLNNVCYMWWDTIPLVAKPENTERDALIKPCLQVMEQTLQLDSLPCQESALHGLGHWQHGQEKRVHAIIDKFLEDFPHINADLRSYALAARQGMVN
jgi:hypothetical protein